MHSPKIAPYGSWQSPITSDLIISGTIGLSSVFHDGENLYWLESRPNEGGRNVIVQWDQKGVPRDVTPTGYNVRTRVHEYGGGAFLIHNNTVYFSNFADQCLYQQVIGESPIPLTQPCKKRFADAIFDADFQRLICVCEDHDTYSNEPENYLASIDLQTGEVFRLVTGDDFYASPRLSSDGKKLAWISWTHPNLPWDGTMLWVADVSIQGTLENIKPVAGGDEEAICQPEWGLDGQLYFSSDRSNWWNLYRTNLQGMIEPLYSLEAEFGFPHWVFGESVYGFINQQEILCTYQQNGVWQLAHLNTQEKQLKLLNFPFTSISYLQVKNNTALMVAGSPTHPNAVVFYNIEEQTWKVLKKSSELTIDENYITIPQSITFPTANGLTAYGWYYPPHNPDYQGGEDSLPPLLVKSHGGPTACTSAIFNLRVQYWTSRGFAYLDVNYGGSTGYGRKYRERLNQNWGIVDVEDCINGAKYLVKQGKVDGEKLAISGGSAGGYTTLSALTFYDTFKAGASYYGVSNLTALAEDTHKFESRYLDKLIGKYPQDEAIYQQRSPINSIEKLSCPVIFFQGLEDKVVPPNQTEMMVSAMQKKGLPVAYVAFEGEQHGFRKAENIKRCLDGEFYFYSRIFGFSPAETIAPIPIDNL